MAVGSVHVDCQEYRAAIAGRKPSALDFGEKAMSRYPPALQRFEDNYTPEPNSGCWLWMACDNGAGYGLLQINGRQILAHRFAYETFIGPIPRDKQLDHLCRVRCCVNPLHLEAVTRKENILRGECPQAKNARKTHCHVGHPLSGNNLHVLPDGSRRCRECNRRTSLRYRKRSGATIRAPYFKEPEQ